MFRDIAYNTSEKTEIRATVVVAVLSMLLVTQAELKLPKDKYTILR